MAAASRHPSLTNFNPIPSSSPAFGTPVHPIIPAVTPLAPPPLRPTILPILLPPQTLRPLAFRTFTKKHNLNFTTSALSALATFIGRHCGSGWREEGLAEKVLEEVAKTWKKSGGPVIVDGTGDMLKAILRTLEGCLSGGRMMQGKSAVSRQGSFAFGSTVNSQEPDEGRPRLKENSSFGMSSLQVEDLEEGDEQSRDPRSWLRVISAFEQPRLVYNVGKKHFERSMTKPTLFPPPSHKTLLFRDRYNLIHQRLLRNEAFQTPSFDQQSSNTLTRSDSMTIQQSYKITPIANLLGRSGSSHLLLGLLTVAPTGTLAISDLTGSIALDLQHAKPHVGKDAAWFCPGMIVLIDGVYEEDHNATTSGLGQTGGIGGTIGGKFIGFSIGGPPCERRNVTVGVSDGVKSENGDVTAGAGFGWVDFLGVGSERATGSKLRRTEQRLLGPDGAHTGTAKMVVCGEVNLDSPSTLEALHKMLRSYATDDADRMPMTVVLMGNFVTHAVMAGGNSGSGGSIEYKEYFNALASVLTEYPALLRRTTLVLVPGDKDPWASAFSAGASAVVPKKGVPDIFTSRVKRAFAEANREAGVKKSGVEGEAVFATNPARISLFGPAHEIVLFRDDISSRLRRTAIRFATLSHDLEQGEPVEADATMMSGGLGTDSSTRENTMDVDTPTPAPAAFPSAESADFETLMARKLVRTVLDQSHLSPFPLSTRPVHWDYASALQLYPLPTTLVLADAEAPAFAVTYEGCHVMNPGRLVREGRGNQIGWLEYDVVSKRGVVKEDML